MSSGSSNDTVAVHGWTAVQRDPKVLLSGNEYINEPASILVKDIPFPSNETLVARVQDYAKEKLPLPTYHHSMRVFYFGMSSSFSFLFFFLFFFSLSFLPLYNQKKKKRSNLLNSIGHPRISIPRNRKDSISVNISHNSPPPRHRHYPREPPHNTALL